MAVVYLCARVKPFFCGRVEWWRGACHGSWGRACGMVDGAHNIIRGGLARAYSQVATRPGPAHLRGGSCGLPLLPHRSDRPSEPPVQRPVHSDTRVKNGGARGSGMSLGGEERARDTLISSRNLFQSLQTAPSSSCSPPPVRPSTGAACSETRPQ